MEDTFEQLEPLLERLRIPSSGVQAASGVEERRFWPRGTTIAEVAAQAAAKALRVQRLYRTVDGQSRPRAARIAAEVAQLRYRQRLFGVFERHVRFG